VGHFRIRGLLVEQSRMTVSRRELPRSERASRVEPVTFAGVGIVALSVLGFYTKGAWRIPDGIGAIWRPHVPVE
jgi:hypothetical protein